MFFRVSLTDLKLAGYSVVDVESTPNQLTDFKLSVTLGGAEVIINTCSVASGSDFPYNYLAFASVCGFFQVKLSNILNDDELSETLEKVLNEKLPTIVNNIAASLEPFVSPIVKSAINIILSETDSE